MPVAVGFGIKDVADSFRDDHQEHLAPGDDARTNTVEFEEDTPERVIEEAERAAAETRAERQAGPGQVELTEFERSQIDFSKGNASIPHARLVKAIMLNQGVDDWMAFYDPTLTVDEHRSVAEQAKLESGEGGFQREGESVLQKEARAAKRAQESECDHARGFCKLGDPEACEFLRENCGLDESDIDQLREAEEDLPDQAISGKFLGALKRSWGGYKGAVTAGDERHAKEAAKAINAIRLEHGQPPLRFDRLESLEAEAEPPTPAEPTTPATPNSPGEIATDGMAAAGQWVLVILGLVALAALAGLPDQPTNQPTINTGPSVGRWGP